MQTQLIGRVDIDQERLRTDLAATRDFRFSEPYIEFSIGRPWSSCMLWTHGGEVGDGVIAHYDPSRPSRPTPYGERLPYVTELIERTFDTEHLLFARLAVMSETVLMPHRDYVEFTEVPEEQRATHRLHVPLATNEDCLFLEDGTVYRMKSGEVWCLDVTRMHSAGVLSDFRRMHVILDFAGVPDPYRLLRADVTTRPGIPAGNTIARPALTDQEYAAVLRLAEVVDLDNLPELFGILIKKNFRRDGGPDFVWRAAREIARRSGRPEIVDRMAELHKHHMLERDE
ncbi:aspartyl/asparaginyl beta-hydroxylase domain-containing protein [Micromonospora sp. NPDC023956]|uniref:aspartyl/asparaginyl beta-hydroxylase domain-containing protein n=1 Tax=Micromonospora sp. NPDC023956 TaxID=3155722 RepID=UPI0033E8F8B3